MGQNASEPSGTSSEISSTSSETSSTSSETSSTSSSKENNLAINDSKVSIDEKKSTVGSNKIQKNESPPKKRKREIEMESCDIRVTKKSKNVTETAVTSDTSTLQLPARQTSKKYITKGEYVKYFARNKSPVPNIRLSIEEFPKAKSIERRNATFTCEADNEIILKKVEGGRWWQEFLDKYGSISEDEEDLIQLPAFDDEQTTELEQKGSQKSNTDNASRELNDTSALNSCANSLNCNIEICNDDKESRNSANISTELSGICKKDSIQGNFSGSSELSLIVDEVENFLLLCRASESEIDEEIFQICDLFKAHVPKLDKITKMSKVKDADYYTVYVNEPIEIHADTKIVQQHCKKDYVIEIKPALPITDLIKESAGRCVESCPKDSPGELSIESKRELMEITKTPPDHATITLYRSEENVSMQEHVQAITGTIPSQFVLRNSPEADVKKDIDSEQKYLTDKKTNISDRPSSNSPNLVTSLELNTIPPKDDMLQTQLSNTDIVVAPQKASESLENENKLDISSIVNIAQPHHSNLIAIDRPNPETAVSSAPLSINTLTAIASVSPTGQNNVPSYSQAATLDIGQQKSEHSSISKENIFYGSETKECNDKASKTVQVEILQPVGTWSPPNLVTINETPKLTQLLTNPPKSYSDNINKISNINSTNKRNIFSRTNQNKEPDNTQQHNYNTAISSQIQLEVREPICLDGNDASTSIPLKTNQNLRPSINQQNKVQNLNASILGPIHSRPRNPTCINQSTDVSNLASTRSLAFPPANENPPPIADQTCINRTADTDEVSTLDQRLIIEILTKHIYFLAHLCKAQNDYIESLRKHTFCKSDFEAEITLFEREKGARSQTLARELQLLNNIEATRNLSGTASLIMNKVFTNLLNRDMPQQATKLMIYLFTYPLLKHSSRLSESSPFLKTLLKHCEIVINRLNSTQQDQNYDTAISSQIQLEDQEPISLDGNDASTSIPLKTNQNPRPSTNQQNKVQNSNASILGPIHSRARNPICINQATDISNLPSTRRLTVSPANENPPPIINQTCSNCTEDTEEVSTLDQRIIIEVLTRHIYFLAHLCKAQNDYVESLRKPTFCKSYFEDEITIVKRQKPARLKKLASELQQLKIDATRNLSGTVLLIMNKVSTNLLNMNMPQQATKSMMYLFMYQLLKHTSRLFESSSFLKTLFEHCKIVVNELYSRLGSAMTPDQRKILTQQINEYNKIVLRQKQINESQFNVELYSRLGSTMTPDQRKILTQQINEYNKIVLRQKQISENQFNVELYSRLGSAMTPDQRKILTQQINEYNKIVLRQKQISENQFNVELYSRLGSAMTPDQRKILTQQINEYNKIVLRQKQIRESQFNVELYSRLGSAMTPDQRKILTQQINEYNKIVIRQKQISEGQFNVEPSRLNNSPNFEQRQSPLTVPISPTLNVLVDNRKTTSTGCVASQPKEPVVLNQGFAALSFIGTASVMLNRSSYSQTSKGKQHTDDVQPHDKSINENKSAEEQSADSLAVNPVQNSNSTDVEQSGLPQRSLVEPQLLTLGAEIRNPQNFVFDSPNIHLKERRKETANSCAKVILNHIEGLDDEDIEIIDLTWIDYVDDNELQEKDFVFVKKEDPKGQGYQNDPNKVVQSPADSGMFSPPIQTEDDTTDYKSSVEKLCGCASTALY